MCYTILGAAQMASSSDNKVATFALIDKIGFRAGVLAGLEDVYDDNVIKHFRFMQGEVLKRSVVCEKRRDQRDLIKVVQRNFRKYMGMRDWGWFVIIQKTRPMIGMPNPEQELGLLKKQLTMSGVSLMSRSKPRQFYNYRGKEGTP